MSVTPALIETALRAWRPALVVRPGSVEHTIATTLYRALIGALPAALRGVSSIVLGSLEERSATTTVSLCKAGRADVTVFAHTTAGHTSRNEYVRFFSGKGDPLGGVGGDDVVARKTPEFAKLRERLHEVKDDLRWRLPYLGADEIHKELS